MELQRMEKNSSDKKNKQTVIYLTRKIETTGKERELYKITQEK